MEARACIDRRPWAYGCTDAIETDGLIGGEHHEMKSFTKTLTTCASIALLILAAAGIAQAESKKGAEEPNRYSENKGFYAYGSLAIIKTNYDVSGIDPNIGFGLGAGYRFMDWLAADVDMSWGGRDQGPVDSRYFGFTMNGKFYPLGLISPTTLDWLQPYVVVGMGGGQGKFKASGGDVKTGTYIFRLGAGTEVFIVGGLAAYMDLSLHATPGLKNAFFSSQGGATGVIQFGAVYHF